MNREQLTAQLSTIMNHWNAGDTGRVLALLTRLYRLYGADHDTAMGRAFELVWRLKSREHITLEELELELFEHASSNLYRR